MGPPAPEPVNFETFGVKLLRLLARLVGERAHVEVVIVIAQGTVQRVRVNRSFLPAALPDG